MTATLLDNYTERMPAAVAIGVFDGVHLGHQAVLRGMRTRADDQGWTALGMTFDPHPAAYFAPERAPRLLCCLSQRVEWMAAPGLASRVVVAPFNKLFAGLSARQFVEEVLVGRLNAREVWVGADFRFGRGRQGGVMELESMGERFGFGVRVARAVASGGERISSSWARSLVERGEMEQAAGLLGRPFTLRGVVARGKQLGRTIGYPTANLQPDEPRQLLPASGVYAGWAAFGKHTRGRVAGEMAMLPAAVSIGTNPTTDGVNDSLKVEAFILGGFGADVYGQPFDLRLVRRIREERKFDSLDALVERMAMDVAEIETFFAAPGTQAAPERQAVGA